MYYAWRRIEYRGKPCIGNWTTTSSANQEDRGKTGLVPYPVLLTRTFIQGPGPGPGLRWQGPGQGQGVESQGQGPGPGLKFCP